MSRVILRATKPVMGFGYGEVFEIDYTPRIKTLVKSGAFVVLEEIKPEKKEDPKPEPVKAEKEEAKDGSTDSPE